MLSPCTGYFLWIASRCSAHSLLGSLMETHFNLQSGNSDADRFDSAPREAERGAEARMGDCGAHQPLTLFPLVTVRKWKPREKLGGEVHSISGHLFLHLKKQGYVGRRVDSAHCTAKNSQAVSPNYGTQGRYHGPSHTWNCREENQTDFVEDEGPREKLERKQNFLPSRSVTEPWELSSLVSLGPQCWRPRDDLHLGWHLPQGQNEVSDQETRA